MCFWHCRDVYACKERVEATNAVLGQPACAVTAYWTRHYNWCICLQCCRKSVLGCCSTLHLLILVWMATAYFAQSHWPPTVMYIRMRIWAFCQRLKCCYTQQCTVPIVIENYGPYRVDDRLVLSLRWICCRFVTGWQLFRRVECSRYYHGDSEDYSDTAANNRTLKQHTSQSVIINNWHAVAFTNWREVV